jgi:segregation and condensation protein A
MGAWYAPAATGLGRLGEVGFEVRTEVFEGPLEVLLRLVAEDRVDVTELSVAAIATAYLEELAGAERVDLEVATAVLLAVAELVQAKCRRLLPAPVADERDEEAGRLEERDLLLSRLVACRTFRAAAAALAAQMERAARSVPRRSGLEEPFVSLAPDLLAPVTPADLAAAAARVLGARPVPVVDVSHLPPVAVSVEEMSVRLSQRLRGLGVASFEELTRGAGRAELIAAFLAVLELCKQGVVEVAQDRPFGELRVRLVSDAAFDAAPSGLAPRTAAGGIAAGEPPAPPDAEPLEGSPTVNAGGLG